MGVLNESAIWREQKKTNELLERLVAEQIKTNEWFAHLAEVLGRQAPMQPGQWHPQPPPWQQPGVPA